MKNLSLYKDNLSVPRKQDVDNLTKRVDDAEAQLIVLDSDISSIETELPKKLTTPTGNQGQLLGFTANNVIGAIDFQGGGAGGVYADKFAGTLTTTWTPGTGNVYQQITVPGMTADQCPLVFPVWTAAKANEMAAWNSLEAGVESFDGYVRFYAPKATTTPVGFTLVYKK